MFHQNIKKEIRDGVVSPRNEVTEMIFQAVQTIAVVMENEANIIKLNVSSSGKTFFDLE